MKLWYTIFAVMLFIPINSLADTWPITSSVYNGLYNKQKNEFVYVPAGEQFVHVKLNGQITAGGNNNVLSVYLDGRLIQVLRPRDKQDFSITFPDLSAGFHRIKIVGHPTVLASPSQKITRCQQIYSIPFSLSELALHYTPLRVAAPQIAQLPDGLYNRNYPSHKPLVAAIDLQPDTPSAFESALRLASWFKANRRIRWESGIHPNANFQIILTHQSNIGFPAHITMQEPASAHVKVTAHQHQSIPTLTIAYRNESGLQAAVMALLNSNYRHELSSSNADLSGAVTPPEWGTLVTPSTLSQLGISNITLHGNKKKSVLLAYPPYWHVIGTPAGHLILRTQSGLANGSHLNIWLGSALAGSDPLAFIGSGKIQQSIPVNGASKISHHTNLLLRLHSVLLSNRICDVPVPGTLWISASDTKISLPHRYKTGVMALLPRLVANPSIVASDSAASLTAALNIAASEQAVTNDKPLPYVVSFKSPLGGAPSLTMLVSQKDFSRVAAAYATKLNQSFLMQSVLLHVKKSGTIELVAPDEQNLANVADVWSHALSKFPDGTLDAALNVESGSVQILAHSPSSAVLFTRNKSGNNQYKLVVLTIMGLFLLTILGLFLWLRRRSKS